MAMSLTPDRFTMVTESRFGMSELRLHPVWARFYEPSDIDIACSWGIRRDVFQRILEEVHTGNDHAMFPVFSLDPLPDDVLDLNVLASFTPSRGPIWEGYATGDAHFICVYATDSTFYSFNSTGTLLAEELYKFQRAHPEVELFPLQYSTGYRRSDGSELSGMFDPR